MFKMLALQLFNWGYTPLLEPLPIGQVNILYGHNGSGKTTYLTAIALLLGIARLPPGHSYDCYIREGAQWAFLRIVADNQPAADGIRPFDRIIPNPDGYCQTTLACLLTRKSGNWQRTYYIVPGPDFQPEPEPEHKV